jgi:ligand-binding sensor domain-containing protein
MRNIVLTPVFLILTGCATLFAQPNPLYFHRLGPENGLKGAYNEFIFQDSRGFVWLSSVDGLNRFDGHDVKVWRPVEGDSTSMRGENIQSPFFEDEAGNIWFTTFEGVNC